MRLGAVAGWLLLLSTLAACTMPDQPILASTGAAPASSVALTGTVPRSAIALASEAAGSPGNRYSLQVVDFDRTRFESAADCFTAASARGLPLVICH